MKILIVSQYYWPEQFRINDIAKGLVEKGHDVTVLTGIPNYPQGFFFKGYGLTGPFLEENDGVKIIRIPHTPRGQKKNLKLALNYLSFMIVSSVLAPFVVKGHFDKIFVFQPSPVFSGLSAVVLKFLKRAKIYFWVTDLWPESLTATLNIKSRFILVPVEWFVKFIYAQSEKVLVSSRGFSERIERLGVSAKKIVYWPQWGEEFFRKKEINLKELKELVLPDGFKVMFAGNIGTSQSFETIVEAADILKDNKNIHWIILGNGLMKPWVEREIVKRGLQEQFHLLGSFPITKMPMFYSKADALLFSLKKDFLFSLTLPGKTPTYLASGKPIIASIDGEGARVIDDAQCGISCQASNPQELANAVLKLSRLTEDERKIMGVNAVEYFDKHFDREKLLFKLEEVMQQSP